MADVKWIKITTDIFDDEKILLIESLPEPYAIITVWFKLLCLAGKQNNSGVFMMGRIAYTEKMLATIFRMKEATVTMALRTFEDFGMVEIVDGVITIPNWGKHQSLDAYEKKKVRDRERIARKRAEQKALVALSPDKSHDKSPVVASLEEDKEEEKDTDIDIKEINKENNDFEKIVSLYHQICISFSSIRSLTDARKKAIGERLNTYTLEDFKILFINAEASSFLKGDNDRGWKANFDWLIKEVNMIKVLEGAFADNPARKGKKEVVPAWMKKRELDLDEMAAINRIMADVPAEPDTDFQAQADELQKKMQEKYGKKE